MVMDFIDKNSMKVEYRDIQTDRTHLEKLVADTGKRTVPCLYIDGKPMFESRDIMAWLDKNARN
jgi:glutaredoxin